MKYELINEPTQYIVINQILYNRGFSLEEISQYLSLTDQVINSPLELGEDNLIAAVRAIITTINNNQDAILIVDCDCDGYTSAALLYNYLYIVFPTWTLNHLQWYMHTSKQHGLHDCVDYIIDNNFSLVLCPDAGSNDYEEHKKLNIPIIVLDHHLADMISPDAIIINNQLTDYPNKYLSGVGVVWQFCRYMDNMLNVKFADQFLDLVALGLNLLG